MSVSGKSLRLITLRRRRQADRYSNLCTPCGLYAPRITLHFHEEIQAEQSMKYQYSTRHALLSRSIGNLENERIRGYVCEILTDGDVCPFVGV